MYCVVHCCFCLQKYKKEPVFAKSFGGVFGDQKLCRGCPHRSVQKCSVLLLIMLLLLLLLLLLPPPLACSCSNVNTTQRKLGLSCTTHSSRCCDMCACISAPHRVKCVKPCRVHWPVAPTYRNVAKDGWALLSEPDVRARLGFSQVYRSTCMSTLKPGLCGGSAY